MDPNEKTADPVETPKSVSIDVKDESSEQANQDQQVAETNGQTTETETNDKPEGSTAPVEQAALDSVHASSESAEAEKPFDPTEPVIIEPTSQQDSPVSQPESQNAPEGDGVITNDGVVAEAPTTAAQVEDAETSVIDQPSDSKSDAGEVEKENTPESIQNELQAAPDMPAVETAVAENDSANTAKQSAGGKPLAASNDTVSQNSPSDLHGPAVVGVAASEMRKQHPHRNNRKLAALVVILVAVLLAGIITYVYLSANSNTQEAVNTTSSNVADDASSETEQVAPATTTDVEDAEKEIDEAINSLDDAVDFAETDLSDTTLGL